jgi:hypothetical protein
LTTVPSVRGPACGRRAAKAEPAADVGASGAPAVDGPYAWEIVAPSDPDHMSLPRRLLHVLADRARGKPLLLMRDAGPRTTVGTFRQLGGRCERDWPGPGCVLDCS